MIKLSVIIPAYNVAPYLPKCLDSVLAQTLKELEIIIVNDTSTDNTQSVIEKYAKRDRRIVPIIIKKRGCPGKARNAGLKVAKGEYIGFVDGDDYIDKDMFAQLYEKVTKSGSDMIVTGFKRVKNGRILYLDDALGRRTRKTKSYKKGNFTVSEKEKIIEGKEVLRSFLTLEFLGGMAPLTICRRELIIKNKIFFPENVFREDMLYGFYMCLHAKKVYLSSGVYYNYVARKGSVMTKITPQHIDGIKITFKKIKETLEENGLSHLKNDFYHNFWLVNYHHQITARITDFSYRELLIASPLWKYIYSNMKKDHPPKKPHGMSMKENIIWLAFSNMTLFSLFYIIFKPLKQLKAKLYEEN